MDMQPPPAFVQVVQAEVPPDAPVDPTPIKVNVSQYIPESANAVTMIVTLNSPTGQALIYAPGNENDATLFKGARSIDEVKKLGDITNSHVGYQIFLYDHQKKIKFERYFSHKRIKKILRNSTNRKLQG